MCYEYEPRQGEMPKIPLNERDVDENPFIKAGYGVNSFFDIMKKLVYMFIGISLVMLPVMGIYKSNNQQGVLGLDKVSWKTHLNKITLGNLGGA